MDICEHCHNVLAKSGDSCKVCGTFHADPLAADVRRREASAAPAHAPGWAAPKVSGGLHPEDFLRELAGESADDTPLTPALPPRHAAVPVAGALAGYLGSTVSRGSDQEVDGADDDVAMPPPPAGPATDDAPPPPSDPHAGQLTTATKLTADGVAARSTRLDGSVKLGPTPNHTLITLGAPLLAALLVVAAVVMSYQIGDSAASSSPVDVVAIDSSAVVQGSSAVVLLELDGCGVLDQTTGFLFADQAILAPRSATLTDDRPTVVLPDGSTYSSEVVGWSLTRDLAVIKADQRLSGGLRWGVSGRSSVGDVVSILTVTGPGVATPVPATIASVETTNGIVTAFALDVNGSPGSVILSAGGFVIGIIDGNGTTHVSDDVSPAVSRIVLANERPAAVCPPRPAPTVPVDDGDEVISD